MQEKGIRKPPNGFKTFNAACKTRVKLKPVKAGKVFSLRGRFKRKSSPRAVLWCTIPVILDGSFTASPSEHLSLKPRKPRTETLICEVTKRLSELEPGFADSWLCESEEDLFWCILLLFSVNIFSFTRVKAVMG